MFFSHIASELLLHHRSLYMTILSGYFTKSRWSPCGHSKLVRAASSFISGQLSSALKVDLFLPGKRPSRKIGPTCRWSWSSETRCNGFWLVPPVLGLFLWLTARLKRASRHHHTQVNIKQGYKLITRANFCGRLFPAITSTFIERQALFPRSSIGQTPPYRKH